ncbi:hypothetical protein, partial [Actinocorallia libanotica]|uniref:hypothetical protein n=1 Tax=Actinocorallia libanotica TaxID=46162 RepID=UPI003CD06A4A
PPPAAAQGAPAGGPPGEAPPQRRRKPKPALLLGAVGVVGLLVVAAGYFGYTSLNSGYYLGAEGQKVVVFEGTNKSLFGFPAASRAPQKEQPALTLADLPNSERSKIRNKSFHSDDLAAIRRELTRLETACKIQLSKQDDTVVIVRGPDQPGCPSAPLTQDPASGGQLPRPDLQTLPPSALAEAQSKEYRTVQDAIKELTVLAERAAGCKTPQPDQNNDCPK